MSKVAASRAIWISASLLPLPLLMAAATTGGIFILLAIAYMTFAIIFIDEYSDVWKGVSPSRGELSRDFFPLVLGIAHFAILGVAVHALGAGSSSTLEWILHLYAFGLFFGVISFANAHQLVKQKSHLHQKLGEWIFASLLFGYYKRTNQTQSVSVSGQTSFFAAKKGENFYRYLRRTIPATVANSIASHADWKARSAKPIMHPLLTLFAIGVLFLALTAWMAGTKAVVGIILVSLIAQTITYLSLYVQHYGLGTKYAAKTTVRKWKSPKLLWSLFKDESDEFAVLSSRKPMATAPLLPFSLMTMCFIALSPTSWHRLMDHRVAVWKDTAKFTKA